MGEKKRKKEGGREGGRKDTTWLHQINSEY
jgi:hypothetical protein